MKTFKTLFATIIAFSSFAHATPTVSVGKIFGARPAELSMIEEGIILANKILATDCFRQYVLNAHFTETNDLNPVQIFDLMDRTPVTVDIEMYTGSIKANYFSHTVGYENDPYDGVVHMNRFFVNSAFMVADNVIHEAEGHSQGFHHYGKKSTSVPYGMNKAFEACFKVQ